MLSLQQSPTALATARLLPHTRSNAARCGGTVPSGAFSFFLFFLFAPEAGGVECIKLVAAHPNVTHIPVAGHTPSRADHSPQSQTTHRHHTIKQRKRVKPSLRRYTYSPVAVPRHIAGCVTLRTKTYAHNARYVILLEKNYNVR
jgi:hypothetical protein